MKLSCETCSGAGAVTDYDSGETKPCGSCQSKDGKPTKQNRMSLDELEAYIRRIVREEMRRNKA